MAYVPGFKYDVFISYARESDVHGHVNSLVVELKEFLTNELGRQFRELGRILFDKVDLIDKPTDWQEALRDAAGSSAMFMPLISPNYIGSDNCAGEWDHFKGNGGLLHWKAGDTSVYRVSPVRSWRVDAEDFGGVAEEIRKAQILVDLMDDAGDPLKPGSRLWRQRITTLGRSVADGLRTMRRSKESVYLGEQPDNSPVANQVHAKIRQELSRMGFRVMPEGPMLYRQPDRVGEMLSEARSAVHLVGGHQVRQPFDYIRESLKLCPRTIVYQIPGQYLTPNEEIEIRGIREDLPPDTREKQEVGIQKGPIGEFLGHLEETLEREQPTNARIGIAFEKADSGTAEMIAKEILKGTGFPVVCHGENHFEYKKSPGLLYYWGSAEGRTLLRTKDLSTGRVAAWCIGPPPDPPKDETQLKGFRVCRQSGQSFRVDDIREFLVDLGWKK